MVYVVCQTPRCQQTYPLQQFQKDDRNIHCEKCGGVLIDGHGRANLSQHKHVIPVITLDEIKQNHQKQLHDKRKALADLQEDIADLENEAYELYEDRETFDKKQPPTKSPKPMYQYMCETGCGHTTIIDKYYKTKRVFCGVCGTKTTMVYQGECIVTRIPKATILQ